jgi:NarL family two-component system sensor histidine kinase LiaS
VVFALANALLPGFIALGLQQSAAQATPFFVHGAVDRQAADAWLHLPDAYAAGTYQQGSLTLVDDQGIVVSSVGDQAVPAGADLAARLGGTPAADLRRTLAGRTDLAGLSGYDAGGALVVMVPIPGSGGRVLGAVVQRQPGVTTANLFWASFYARNVVLPTALVFLLLSGLVGTVFGLRTGRRFIGRFNRVAEAVDRWSRGDLSAVIDDRADDEIGQLGRQLDRLAAQTGELLRARHELATLEERDRLSRELHDSVKQEAFGLSMEISTARALLANGSAGEAQRPLAEAERLAQQMQTELATLIHELRPAALGSRSLGPALEDYVAAWSRRARIPAEVAVTLDGPLAPDVEQALFRVAQEALSNVARHSAARRARVRLAATDGGVVLEIADDGAGLDAAARPGVGLESMRERMERVGGSFAVSGRPGAGTTVQARA